MPSQACRLYVRVCVWGRGGDHGSWSSSGLPEQTTAGGLKGPGQLPPFHPGRMPWLSPPEGAPPPPLRLMAMSPWYPTLCLYTQLSLPLVT